MHFLLSWIDCVLHCSEDTLDVRNICDAQQTGNRRKMILRSNNHLPFCRCVVLHDLPSRGRDSRSSVVLLIFAFSFRQHCRQDKTSHGMRIEQTNGRQQGGSRSLGAKEKERLSRFRPREAPSSLRQSKEEAQTRG